MQFGASLTAQEETVENRHCCRAAQTCCFVVDHPQADELRRSLTSSKSDSTSLSTFVDSVSHMIVDGDMRSVALLLNHLTLQEQYVTETDVLLRALS